MQYLTCSSSKTTNESREEPEPENEIPHHMHANVPFAWILLLPSIGLMHCRWPQEVVPFLIHFSPIKTNEPWSPLVCSISMISTMPTNPRGSSTDGRRHVKRRKKRGGRAFHFSLEMPGRPAS